MKHTSIIINSPCELIPISRISPFISRVLIKVCYVGQNRNGSVMEKDFLKELANTLPGSPIVGYYQEKTEDFEEHNRIYEIVGNELKIKDPTKPYGFVDLSAKAWFQDYLDDGVVHTYLVTEGYIWTGQYPESRRIIEQGNNQSMELDEDSLQGSWTIDDNSGMEFFIINEAIISKLCILGEEYEPCFEGSTISKFSLDKDFHQRIYALMKEVRDLKGGELSVLDKELEQETSLEEEEVKEEEVIIEEEEAPAEEEIVEEEVPEEVEPEEEPAQEETLDEANQFSLADFQELQQKYSTLETQYSELQASLETLQTENAALVEFKQVKEREAKQALIDEFYMLSDEEKADVQENIDNYSLEDIEAKLAIICVHNKLDLSKGASEKDDPQVDTSFSLNELELEEDDNVPSWVSALRKTKNIED